MQICDKCAHIDYRKAAERGMKGFGLCAKARNIEEKAKYTCRTSQCFNGQFQKADDECIKRRREWFRTIE